MTFKNFHFHKTQFVKNIFILIVLKLNTIVVNSHLPKGLQKHIALILTKYGYNN